MLVPKLRFKREDGTEYSNWKEGRLKEFSSYITSTGTATKSVFVGTENMQKECAGVVFDIDTDTIVKGVQYEPNDVLVSNIRPYLKKAWKADRKGVCSTDVLCIRGNSGIKSDFLYSMLSSDNFFEYVMQGAKGTKMPRGDKSHIMDMPVTMPCLEEQQKIADFISTVDKVIAQSEQEVQNLEQQKKATMQKIFSQEVRFRRDDGTNYPNWEEKKLSDVCDVRDGTHDSPKYVSVGYPLVTSKNLTESGIVDLTNVSFISKEDYDNINKRSLVEIGDILIGMIGTIGKPVIVTKAGFAIKNVALLKAVNIYNIFLYFYLQSDTVLAIFRAEQTGNTQHFISLSKLRELCVVVPHKEEQQKIADFLSAYDEAIAYAKQELGKWKQLKKGLLQQMFV